MSERPYWSPSVRGAQIGLLAAAVMLTTGCSIAARCRAQPDDLAGLPLYGISSGEETHEAAPLYRLQGIYDYSFDYSTITLVIPEPSRGPSIFRVVPFSYCLNETSSCERESERRWGRTRREGAESRSVFVDAIVRKYEMGSVIGCPGGWVLVVAYGPTGWATAIDDELVEVEAMTDPLAPPPE